MANITKHTAKDLSQRPRNKSNISPEDVSPLGLATTKTWIFIKEISFL